MNRKERRTKGLAMAKRLQQILRSKILNNTDLTTIPEDSLVKLKEGTHENPVMQKQFDLAKKLLAEKFYLESQLQGMKNDLKEKKAPR